MKDLTCTLKKFVRKALGKIRSSGMPAYSHKHSPKKYASHCIVIDSTGFATYSSSWYERLASRIRKHRYAKLCIAADPVRQLILNAMPGIGYSHDVRYLIPLAQRLDFEVLIADKGFDSLRNIAWVLSRGAKPLIAIRRNAKRELRLRLRRRNKHVYSHRAKAETIISVIKRKFGEHLSSRSWPALRKEIILLALAYNAHRESLFLNLLIWSKITSICN
jgi:hypothetical protein